MVSEEDNTALSNKLQALIADNGWLSVEEYMSLCLGAYYGDRDPLGWQGDFITAPEICQVFGELIGLWACEMWRLMGEPKDLKLIELGPGRGTLMGDALRASRILPEFISSTSVHLVEVSRTLRHQQSEALAQHKVSISHYDDIADIEDGPSIVIANEFFDALPVRQFVYADDGWFERGVVYSDGFQYIRSERQVDLDLAYIIDDCSHSSPVDGDIFEYREQCSAVMEVLSKREQFAALIIDYGHEVSGFGDTLQAVQQHKFADPLEQPGLVDLTTQVDFNQLQRLSSKLDLNCFGPMTQGQFLLMLGMEQRLNQLLMSATEEQSHQLKTGAVRLVAPDQMGVLFKVMSVTSEGLPKPPPFK